MHVFLAQANCQHQSLDGQDGLYSHIQLVHCCNVKTAQLQEIKREESVLTLQLLSKSAIGPFNKYSVLRPRLKLSSEGGHLLYHSVPIAEPRHGSLHGSGLYQPINTTSSRKMVPTGSPFQC